MRLLTLLLFSLTIFASSVSQAADSHYLLKLEIGEDQCSLLEVMEIPGAFKAQRAELKRGADFRYEFFSAGQLIASGKFRDPRRITALFDERFIPAGQPTHYHGVQKSGVAFVRVPALSDGVLRVSAYNKSSAVYQLRHEIVLSSAPFRDSASFKFKATGDVEMIEQNGPAENRLDIVILGDGYTADEQDKLYDDAVWLADEFTAVEPWLEYRDYFNFHMVHVVSMQSGADHPSQNKYVDTALDAQYDYAGLDRLLVVDSTKARQIAAAVPGYDYVFVLVNEETYGGSGGEVAVTSLNEYAPEILLHEAGHMIGDLADEYDDPWPGYVPIGEEANVTVETDPDRIKWRIWIDEDTPLPTPETNTYADVVGLFEGARYQASGIYRPKLDCRMRVLGVDFCEVCTEALLESLYVEVTPSDAVGGEVYLYENENVTLDAARLQTASGSVKVSWTIDSILQEDDNTDAMAFSQGDMTEGVHTVTAAIVDESPLIRRNDVKDLARTSVEWTLIVEGGPNPDGDSDNVSDGDSDGDSSEQSEEIIEDGDSADNPDGDNAIYIDGDESTDGDGDSLDGSGSSSGCAGSGASSWLLLVVLAVPLLRRALRLMPY